MASLTPVPRYRVPDAVADQLQARILDGDLPPGGDLPSERRLAELLGVSRPTVREALRQLDQRGLVAIRQGGATTVRDYRRTAGLDLLPSLLLRDGELDLDLVRDIVDARSAIAPQLARAAAAVTARTPLAPAADAALLDLAASVPAADDPLVQQQRSIEFWSAVVDRSGSMVYRLLLNGLQAAFEPGMAALAEVLRVEEGHPTAVPAVAQAIVAGDADGAEQAAHDLLARGRDAVIALLDQLQGADLDLDDAPTSSPHPADDPPDHPADPPPPDPREPPRDR